MRTYSTILSLLLILAFANATKMVSYSDIVYSLMELSGDDSKLASLKEINLSFADTKAKLEAFDNKLKTRCQNGVRMGTLKVQGFFNQYTALEKNRDELLAKQVSLVAAEKDSKTLHQQAEEAIQYIKEKIKSERLSLREKENKVIERTLIFKRLLNFIEDEITAVTKRTTEMGKFNVDKKFSSAATSFVEFERIKNDLSEIANSASDPIAKSMISTLIMLTQSQKGSLFSDPELVNRVKNLIKQLEDKDRELIKAEIEASNKNVDNFNSLISEKIDEINKKRTQSAMNVAEIENITQIVRTLQIEIDGYKKAQEKQKKKNANYDDLCQKQDILIQKHQNFLKGFEEKTKKLELDLN